MQLCIFNPEHDLCLAKGRANYVPPRSAVEFAIRDASVMQVLYPQAICCSVYDYSRLAEARRQQITAVVAWGWDAVVKHELLKQGIPPDLLPSDSTLLTIRRLQHRSTIAPLQPDAIQAHSELDVEQFLTQFPNAVMKAPWSGAGRGLRWLHHSLSDIDRQWIVKVVKTQQCVIVEPTHELLADIALEYSLHQGNLRFEGYSLFRTGSGVYKNNLILSDSDIEKYVSQSVGSNHLALSDKRSEVEQWLIHHIAPCYEGPLGIDLMVAADHKIYVAEMNLRHTMGMIAHQQILNQK